eukprot:s7149_g2.t1
MGDRGGQKRKIDDLLKGLNDVKATQKQQQQQQLDSLTTRVDRIEKSTSLVVEFASQVEAAYKTAEETRDFKNLAKQAAEALCAELGPKINLPYPLPSQTPEQWFAALLPAGGDTVCTTWWAFLTALLVGTRFILPNKLRSTRDPNTNQRVRAPGHFLFKLEFGDLSFAVSRALQAGLGAHINQSNRPEREINSQSLCIVRQRNRIVEIVETMSTMGIRIRIRVHEAEEMEVHAAAAERAVVAKAGIRHLKTFHPSK